MARVSNADKQRYKRVGTEDGTCFYCDGPGASMEDFTPTASASAADKEIFAEEWTRAAACPRCWKKIYTHQIVNYAVHGLRKGCMTVSQKIAFVKGRTEEMPDDFLMSPVHNLVLRTGTLRSNDYFFWNGIMFSMDEMKALQPALAVRSLRMDADHVDTAYLGACLLGNIDVTERDADYRRYLNL